MPALYLKPWLTPGLALVFLVELALLGHFPDWRPTPPPSKHRAPRPLRPRTPDDCPVCRKTAETSTSATIVVPMPSAKAPRGPLREKTIETQGYACPHSNCKYGGITDGTVHALIAYGHHGRHEPIQDLYCKA